MIGIQFFEEPSKFLTEFYKNKLITVKASDNVIRILPPLNVKKEEIDEGINIINKYISKNNNEKFYKYKRYFLLKI